MIYNLVGSFSMMRCIVCKPFHNGETPTSCCRMFNLKILYEQHINLYSSTKSQEPSIGMMGMIWNLVCSFSMMNCIVCRTFIVVGLQLPVQQGHTCPMDTFLLVVHHFHCFRYFLLHIQNMLIIWIHVLYLLSTFFQNNHIISNSFVQNTYFCLIFL